jgi:16S rRNA (uracil1498-N3)-methyltransferase
MLPRFFAPDLSRGGETVVLPEDEARHLVSVLRLGPGAVVAVFDGQGREYRAVVDRVERTTVRVRPLEAVAPAPEPAVRLTVALAVLKGERMDDAVRDLAMMGAAAIQPIASSRTALSPGTLARGRAAARWRRIAVASVKQCRRAVVPQIADPVSFATMVEGDRSERRLILVEPSAASPARGALESLVGGPPASALIAIGPEGGWSPDEIQRAIARGFTPITLGRRTLRADAVPIVAIGVLLYLWGDL